jgi:hypothetical protein
MNRKCIVNNPSYIKPEDGLNKRPKHVACLAYYIIVKIHWSCVDIYTYNCVLPFVTFTNLILGQSKVKSHHPVLTL